MIEMTEIRVMPLAQIDLQHAVDEGEGYASVAEWRAGHEGFWHSGDYREAVGQPDFTVNDTTLAVAQRFRLAEDLRTL